MNQEQRQMLLLLPVLLASGALAWWLSLRPAQAPDVRGLAQLPSTLNDWTAMDLEIDQSVSDMLRADANVQRAYLHPQGYAVYVYVGYYGTERGGVPEHTPDICYPAQGWQILSGRNIRIGGREGLSAREFVVEKGGERRLVHFWYRTRTASGITSTFGLQLRQFWGRVTSNRGDGALVRLSTPVYDGDLTSARAKLMPLGRAVDHAISSAWPTEAEVGTLSAQAVVSPPAAVSRR